MNKIQKPEYIFVIEDKMGGVAYLNKNLINNTSLRSNVLVKVILVDQIDSHHSRFSDTILADEIIRFHYYSNENRYSVLKRFHKLLGNTEGAIICNEGLEMQAIYEHGTNKTVYQIIHDFYNLRLAVKLGAITDVYIAHTCLFRDVLQSSDPATVKSFFLPHGVSIPKIPFTNLTSDVLRIVFTGRLVESKGVQDLYNIQQLLQQKGIFTDWTIIGKGSMKTYLENQWKDEKNIRFASPDTNEEVMSLMSKHDLFVLPTRFEGSPVSILEALSVGVVPVVSDLPGGIREIVNKDIGRTIPVGKNELFAEAISELHNNRDLLTQLKVNGRKLTAEKFDIRNTSDNYFDLFSRFKSFKRDHSQLPVLKVGFRLDKKWLPNIIVSFLRKRKKA